MKKFARFFISLCLFSFLSPVFADALAHYALIIDAGSTGSRLHLFEYAQGKNMPIIRDIFFEDIKPGLSFYEKTPEAAGPSLKKILDEALAEIQKNHIEASAVRISLLGTAGMRLLPAARQKAIYNSISLYLKTHYPFTLGEIKTIPGNLEGLFGWLDVNYLLKNFDSNRDITQGSIDMGGASTEIVFSTLDKSKAKDEFNLKLAGKNYTIYSKSFLGMGLVEALNQLNSQPLSASCYPAHYPLSPTTQGSFNFSRCTKLYQSLINQHQREQLPSLAKAFFIAHSGAYYTANFFKLDKTSDKEQIKKRVQEVCSRPWEDLVASYPQVPAVYLARYCANAVYLNQLFYGSYRLKRQQVTVSNQINQQALDWTLGALLYQLTKKQSPV